MSRQSVPQSNLAQTVNELIATVARLRAPDGCPWDKVQTHQSLRPHLLEEAHEVLTVLDTITDDTLVTQAKYRDPLQEELGDLLMQVVIHCQLASERGAFDFESVARGLNDKLVRRHPHVFGETKAKDATEAVASWEQQKLKEKTGSGVVPPSVLDGLPKGLPALARSQKVIEKVSRVGFQWNDLKGPLDKVREEFAELEAEIPAGPLRKFSAQEKQKIESELGDVFFSLCNLSFLVGVAAEDSLRTMLQRFERRFRYVERAMTRDGVNSPDTKLPVWDKYWDESKVLEKTRLIGITGGAASGKSTVSDMLRAMGHDVVDADEVSRSLSEPGGKAYPLLLQEFGTADRVELRQQVFKNPDARKKLEGILHPLILEASESRFLALAKKQIQAGVQTPIVFYEATLLIESGRANQMSAVWVVQATEANQLARLASRPGITPELAGQILAAQMKADERAKHATVLIKNDGTLEELRQQIEVLTKN